MTQSTVCPSCNRSLVVSDVVVNTLRAVRKIQTCGRVIVQRKGHVIAAVIEANEGVEVDGVLDGSVVTQGPVRLGKTATWKGDYQAPSLSAESGCVVAEFFEVEARLGAAPPRVPP